MLDNNWLAMMFYIATRAITRRACCLEEAMPRPIVALLFLLLILSGYLRADGSLPEGTVARLGRDPAFRHGGSVSDLMFTPDGKTLVSAAYDGTIRFWEPNTGRELRRLAGHQSFAHLALSSDGKLLVSGGADATVRLWDAVTGQEKFGSKEHRGYVSAVSLSPDGNTIASASQDRTVRLWDVATGKQRLKIDAHEDYVNDVAFSPDGKLLASASGGLVAANQQPKNPDLSIRLWDPATGQRVATLEGHTRGIYRLAFSPDGKLLASASWQEGKVRLWEMPAGKAIRVLQSKREEPRIQPGVRNDFYSLAFSRDGKLLAAGSTKQTVSLWEVTTGKELPALQGRNEKNESRSRIQALSFAPDGKTLAGGSEDGTIRQWDLATGKERFDLGTTTDVNVQAVAFAPDGKLLASADGEKNVTLWNWASGKESRRFPGAAHRLVFSPDGKLLASVDMKGEVILRDLVGGAEVSRPKLPNPEYANVDLAFSPDGKTLAAAYRDALLLWDTTANKERSLVRKEKQGYRGVAFAPDGKFVATFGVVWPTHDARITLWNSARAAEALTIEVDRLGKMWSYLVAVEFAPDGRTLTGVSMDRAIRQWELASGKEVRLIAQPEPNSGSTVVVRTAAFAPDRRLLALARDKDASLRLWDVDAGKELRTIEPHEGVIYGVAFSPDGKRLVTGHQGGSILVWDVADQVQALPVRDIPSAELDKLWVALAGDDAALAFQAARTLAGGGDKTSVALGDRLRAAAAAPVPEGIRQLLLRLDHELPAVRDAAALELKNYSPAVDSLLRKVLEGQPSAQVRKVLEAHLQSNERGLRLPAGDLLRTVRAVAVLERLDTPSARTSLEALAKGPGEGLASQEAKLSLERLQARSKQP
jgi:WD40 repeat protein